jgi:hypothetical protein
VTFSCKRGQKEKPWDKIVCNKCPITKKQSIVLRLAKGFAKKSKWNIREIQIVCE